MVCYAALLWRLVTLPQCVACFFPGPELLQYYSHGCYKMRHWQTCRGWSKKRCRLVGPLCGWLPFILSSSFPTLPFPPLHSLLPSTWALLEFSSWEELANPVLNYSKHSVVKDLHAGFWLKAEFSPFSEGQGSCHTWARCLILFAKDQDNSDRQT